MQVPAHPQIHSVISLCPSTEDVKKNQLILGQTSPHAVIHRCITGQSEGPVLAYSEARRKQQKVPLRGRSGHGADTDTPHCCTQDKPFTLTRASAEAAAPSYLHSAPGKSTQHQAAELDWVTSGTAPHF